VTPPQELERIVSECARRNLILFVDEAYMRLVLDSEPFTTLSLPGWRDTVVVVGSFSKQFAVTGWRCGYLIANPEVIAEALKIQDIMVICAPVPVQRGITAVLESEPNYAARWLPELRKRRDYLVDALNEIPRVTAIRPTGAFFLMAHIEGMIDSRALALDLIDKQQVVTIPGAFFGRAAEGYLRLSYGAVSLDRLREAISRIREYLKS
jgi:aspartate/methionine/tyrosine aminotransferase